MRACVCVACFWWTACAQNTLTLSPSPKNKQKNQTNKKQKTTTTRPSAKYAPWFAVPLKGARLAVKVIGLLSDESRASRLSFADVVKRLADAPEDAPTFVSKKADRVERFVVVHGQIFLNQIAHFPKKDVQRAPFVAALKQRMETRRHHKLYYVKHKALRGKT